MLHFCCPGLYPGVLLWPICHPTSLNNLKAWPRSVWSWRRGLMARLSQLFSQFREDSDRHFSESMVLASLSPPSLELVHSLGDPLLSRSSVCSSFRPVSEISAHCSHLRGSSHLDSTRTLVPRPLIRKSCPPYDPQLKTRLATRRGHSPCCGSLRSVPGLG